MSTNIDSNMLVDYPTAPLLTAMIILLLVSIALLVFYYVCAWKVYKKFGLSGWKSIIPIYSNYVLASVLVEKALAIAWTVMTAITLFLSGLSSYSFEPTGLSVTCGIVTFILQILIMHALSTTFGHGGWFTVGLVVLPLVFWAILAFGQEQPKNLLRSSSQAKFRVSEPNPYED